MRGRDQEGGPVGMLGSGFSQPSSQKWMVWSLQQVTLYIYHDGHTNSTVLT